VITRSLRYRLYPDAEQAERLRQHIGVVRLLYNLALVHLRAGMVSARRRDPLATASRSSRPHPRP
jgi:transposase